MVSHRGPAVFAFTALTAALAACAARPAPEPSPSGVETPPETELPSARERARESYHEARAALERRDFQAAQAHAGSAIDLLLSGDEVPENERTAMLHALGNLAQQAGALPAAERARRSVLEVCTRTVPPDHRDLQRARMNLAITLKSRGELPEARALYEQVIEVYSRTLPPEHADLLAAQQSLAVLLAIQNELPEARKLFEAVLDVSERTLPPDHPDLQHARANLAVLLHSQGDLAASRALHEQALEVQQRTLAPDDPNLQLTRLALGAVLYAQGDLAAARVLQEEAIEVLVRTLPPEHQDLRRARASLATTLLEQGDSVAARELLEQVLAIQARTLPSDHPELLEARNSLAIALKAQGDLFAARVLFEQVLEVRARTLPPEDVDLQRARLNVAVVLKAEGDLPGARALYERVLEVYERTLPPEHLDLQLARINLANVLRAQGELDSARALQEKALAARLRILPPDHSDVQAARLNLANTLSDQGDLAGARALQEQVLGIRERRLPPDHPELDLARGNLAATLAAEVAADRDGPAAREERIGRCRELAAALTRSATGAARVAMLGSASREAEERCVARFETLSRALSVATGCGVFEPDPALAREAFRLSETTRAAAIVSARLARLAASPERGAALRQTLRSASEELARLARSGAAREAYDAAIAERDRAQREIVQLASGTEGAAELLAEPDPEEIARRLEEREVLVAFRRYSRLGFSPGETRERSTESLCAFVLRRDSEMRVVELGPIEPIEAAAQAWHDALGAGTGRGVGASREASASSAATANARRLGALVFGPLLPSLTDARRLVLVLDDVLHAAPLDALPASDAGLLGDRYEIELRSTIQEIRATAASSPSADLLVVAGGADYSAEPGGRAEDGAVLAGARFGLLRGGAWEEGFAPLPGTLAEARGVAELAASTGSAREIVLLEGREASRPALEQLVPRARVLHLATHGWFAAEGIRSWYDWEEPDPHRGAVPRPGTEVRILGSSPMLLCGLALAGANRPADAIGRSAGIVTAEEISTWDLSRCDLAVLSACDTNVGQRRAGQGVASLQRALHMAGARSVITSLWKVPDEATQELMLEFYRRIWVERQPKSRALWEAKRMLREAKDERGAPRYETRDWAAWVLTGEPE